MSFLLQVISLLVVSISGILIIWRILTNAGIKLKLRIDKDISRENHSPGIKECALIFSYAMLFRIFIIIAGFIIHCVFNEGGNEFHFDQIADVWLKWDANNYIRISHGYTSFMVDNDYSTLVFFPLYSVFLRAVNIFIPNSNIAGLVTSALCCSGACMFLYKLVCIDYPKSAAQKAVVLMSIFPFGFFYSAIMSESAFLLTSIATLFYIRKHNWAAAGVIGMLCALSRSAGVFLIFPATVEFIEEYRLLENLKDIKPKLIVIAKKWTWLLLIPIGTCIYLYINYKVAGNPFEFLRLEEKYWNQTSQPFFKTVGNLWNIINGSYSVSTKMGAFIPGLVILLGMYAVMLISIPKHKSMYSAWLLVYLIVNTTMSWPLSLCRYLSCAVPVYVFLGDMCDKNNKLNTALLLGFGILFGIYMTGYLMGKQIM